MGDKPGGYRIRDLESSQRPRERLASLGATSLSNAELIAILLRTGIKGINAVQLGQKILMDCGGLAGLHRLSYTELCRMRGVGPAKAAQIKAAVELGNRFAASTPTEHPVIQSPEDVASLILYEMGALEQEHLNVMLLDTRNRMVKLVEVYRGSLNSSLIRVSEVFKEAIRANAAAIIVVHNHPSGDPTPSPEDISVTHAIVQAGKLLDIEVLDHIVVGINKFISLKSRSLGF